MTHCLEKDTDMLPGMLQNDGVNPSFLLLITVTPFFDPPLLPGIATAFITGVNPQSLFMGVKEHDVWSMQQCLS